MSKKIFFLLILTNLVKFLVAQNIGIGTSNPTSKLHIQSNGTTALSSALNVANSANTSLLFVGDDGKVGINTTTPTTGLHLISNEGLLAAGTFGSGTTLNLGGGTRMWFYPKKGAFRAGFVNGTQWNDSTTGNYSIALGINTTARGNVSFAVGDNAVASGYAAVSMGDYTAATANYTTAIGSLAKASASNATAIGTQTTASGGSSTAIGRLTLASGSYSTAMGSTTTSSGGYSTAIGASTIASGNYSLATGRQDTSSGSYSFTTGQHNRASADYAMAMGVRAISSGYASFAVGDYVNATGNYAVAMGSLSTASGISATAMGKLTSATGDFAMALGKNTTANAYNEIVLGAYNTLATTPTGNNWVNTDRLLTIGNGISTGIRSDAMVILKNGNTGIGNSNPTERLVVFNGTTTGSYTATGWVHSSDRRLKTNIAGITNALNIVSQLNGVYYDWKGNAEAGRQVGFIAQDIKAVLPEVVTGKEGDIEKGEILGVSYGAVVPVLVEAIKELKAENEALIKRVESLEKEASSSKGQ